MDEKRIGGESRGFTEEELRRMVPIDLETLEAVLFGHALLEEEADDSFQGGEQRDRRGDT